MRAWRLARGLKVAELAVLLGRPLSTTSKKINGHLSLTLDLDRQIENIELIVRLGGVPAGSPLWLQSRLARGLGWDPQRRRRPS